MTVGANIRIAPVAGEAVPATPGEAANPAEIFGEIISCLAVPSPEAATPGLLSEEMAEQGEGAIAAAPEAEVPQSPLEAVQQLLSLAAGAAPRVRHVTVEASKNGDPHPAKKTPEEGLPGASVLPATLPTPAALVQAATMMPAQGSEEAQASNPAVPPEAGPLPSVENRSEGGSILAPIVGMVAKGQDEQPKTGRIASNADAAGEGPPTLVQAPQLNASPLAKDAGRSVVDQLGKKVEVLVRASDQPLPTTPPIAQLVSSLLPRKLHAGPTMDAAEPIAVASAAPAQFAAIDSIALSPVLGDAPRSGPLELAASNFAPQAENKEFAVEHQLDLAHEGEWLDQLARDISQAAAGEGKSLRFRLNPETLGTLRVEIAQDRQGAAIRLTADTEAARSVIADAQPRLLAEARAQGLRISEAHVDLGGQNASGDSRRQRTDFEEAPLRTARSLQEEAEGDGKPTSRSSERYA